MTSGPRLTSPPLLARRRRTNVKSTSSSSRRAGSSASESLLSSGSVGYESVAVQSAELRSTTAMQKGQAWRQRRDRDPERAVSDQSSAGCEPAGLAWVEQISECMFSSRDVAERSLRVSERQICCGFVAPMACRACFSALLCVSSGGTCSDAQWPVSACVRLWHAHAEERASGVLEGVAELRRERVRQTMCGHRDAVARKAFPIAVSNCLSNYFIRCDEVSGRLFVEYEAAEFA